MMSHGVLAKKIEFFKIAKHLGYAEFYVNSRESYKIP